MKKKTYIGFIVSLTTGKVEEYQYNHHTPKRLSSEVPDVPKDEDSIVPTVHKASKAKKIKKTEETTDS